MLTVNEIFFSIQGEGTRAGRPCVIVRLTGCPRAFEEAARVGTRPETSLRFVTPLIDLSKREVVKKGLELGVPLEKTWSCYQAEDRACGACESCRLRLRGFEEAGVSDPLPYRATSSP